MSNIKYDISIPPGLKLLAGTILEPERLTAESLKEDILGLCLDNEDQINADVVGHLVNAYIDLLIENDEEFELTDGDAEQIYREYAIKGWRESVSREYPEAVKSRDDNEVYDSCDWYEFGSHHWPAQLIAEVGYLLGYKGGRQGIAMTKYYEAHKKEALNA